MANVHDSVLDEGVSRSRLARVYAEALLAVAAKTNQRDEIGDQLDDVIRNVFATKPEVEAFLNNPTISKRQKEPLLREAFAGCAEPIRNLLGVLNQNNRLGLVRSLAAVYRDLRDQHAGRLRVTVKSAVPLSDEQVNQLKATLEKSLNKSPVIVPVVEPELIGGLIVQIGDRVIDTSVRTRIQTLRAQLMERGTSYVLQ
ncbi:F0F1 ATP synthase subunit delta [Limnoglobus roseus]|uniref:ATP synthase subunit delta n=1 Tax=Limnoglobus roseus TaxID=2598579 RepID=A0A5C1AH22_9BACT|nr:F0F1 ATP synthase subunit delta [Limnoglobus roseus]QEL17042.1 ATP synthase F1 subunit delta [Limnoglobus roseus]